MTVGGNAKMQKLRVNSKSIGSFLIDSVFGQGHGNWESLVRGPFCDRDPLKFQHFKHVVIIGRCTVSPAKIGMQEKQVEWTKLQSQILPKPDFVMSHVCMYVCVSTTDGKAVP